MGFKRICSVCNFKGMDIEYFTLNKKVCDSCIKRKEEEKELKSISSKLKKREYSRKWRIQNKEYGKTYLKKWSKENTDKIKEYNKKNYKKRTDYSKNYSKSRRKIDPMFKLKMNLRNLIKNGLINQGYSKRSNTYKIIGIPYDEFKSYIENQFKDGMSWENYGEWHLDHKIPISSASSEEEAYNLCYYENFQPLWAKENLEKSNNIIYP